MSWETLREGRRRVLDSTHWHQTPSPCRWMQQGLGREAAHTQGWGLQPGVSRYPVGPRQSLQSKLLTQLLPRTPARGQLWERAAEDLPRPGTGWNHFQFPTSASFWDSNSSYHQRSYHPSTGKEEVCLRCFFFPTHNLVKTCSGDSWPLGKKHSPLTLFRKKIVRFRITVIKIVKALEVKEISFSYLKNSILQNPPSNIPPLKPSLSLFTVKVLQDHPILGVWLPQVHLTPGP